MQNDILALNNGFVALNPLDFGYAGFYFNVVALKFGTVAPCSLDLIHVAHFIGNTTLEMVL